MFIEKLKPKFQVKPTMIKFPTFLHLCTSLHDYRNLVSSHEVKPTSSQHENFEVVNQNSYQDFKGKNKGFLKINPPQQPKKPINNQFTIVKAMILDSYGDLKRQFTPLIGKGISIKWVEASSWLLTSREDHWVIF
jgi:hypothetical protein